MRACEHCHEDEAKHQVLPCGAFFARSWVGDGCGPGVGGPPLFTAGGLARVRTIPRTHVWAVAMAVPLTAIVYVRSHCQAVFKQARSRTGGEG